MAEKSYDELYRKYGKDQSNNDPETAQFRNDQQPAGEDLGLFDRVRMILTSPEAFFGYVADEPGFRNPIVYVVILGAFFFSLIVMTNYIGFGNLPIILGMMGIPEEMVAIIRPTFDLSLVPKIALSIAVYAITKPAFLLTCAAFTHLIAKVLGGKGRFESTFKALSYGETPSAVFGWIPLVGILTFIWSAYLQIIGVSKTHGISKAKSAVTVLIIPIILIALILTLTTSYLSTYFGTTAPKDVFEPCMPCFSQGDIIYEGHGADYLALRVAGEEITNVRASCGNGWTEYASGSPFPSGSIAEVDSQGFFSGDCQVMVEYQIASSGETRTADASLHSLQYTE
jgi:hypothetical protein